MDSRRAEHVVFEVALANQILDGLDRGIELTACGSLGCLAGRRAILPHSTLGRLAGGTGNAGIEEPGQRLHSGDLVSESVCKYVKMCRN
jgi:hypothetical protein